MILQQTNVFRAPKHCASVTPCSRSAARRPVYTILQAATDDARPASSGSDSDSEASTSGAVNGDLRLPKRGFFSIADTKAEVYSRAGEKFDPMKKGGRYKPEFIWNTDWQTALEREESLRRKVEEARARPKAPSSGFLSLSRLSELDRMDVDLSDMLVRKRKDEDEASQEGAGPAAAARQAPAASTSGAGGAGGAAGASAPPRGPAKTVPAQMFTRKEVNKLGRLNRSQARTQVLVEVPALDAEKARQAEAERQRYDALKNEQQLWTLAFSAAGFAMTYVSYSQDVAVSYVVGALGGFTYLRLLSRSVDAVGGDGLSSGADTLAAQPRLLIPIVLGLGYNRFNSLYSETLGVHLELLPMLVGFFTYKLAVVARQYKDVFDGKV